MKIALASDHAGYGIKEEIKKFLISEGLEVVDLGTDSEESCDYPVYGKKCALAVTEGKADRGVAVCGTGIGISIMANRYVGIRCALCTNPDMAEMARKHNDANMLALGGRLLEKKDAIDITKAWLYTDFDGERHCRRVGMLDEV